MSLKRKLDVEDDIEDIHSLLFALPTDDEDSEAEGDPEDSEEETPDDEVVEAQSISEPHKPTGDACPDSGPPVPALQTANIMFDASLETAPPLQNQSASEISIDRDLFDMELQGNGEIIVQEEFNDLFDLGRESNYCNDDDVFLNGNNSQLVQEEHVVSAPDEDCKPNIRYPTKWGRKLKVVKSQKISYQQKDPACTLPLDGTEKDLFLLFFTNEIIDDIVNQTNAYARARTETNQKPKKKKGNKFKSKTPENSWKPITSEELKAYLGILIMMGIHNLPSLKSYWSSDPLLGVDAIANIMTRERFKSITRNLHCNATSQNAPRGSPEHDKLHKIRPLISAISESISKTYEPSSRLSVDESMIPFKGRSSLKQYMPMKPVKRGYKVWCLADAMTGFTAKFQIYTGKTEGSPELALGERVVTELTDSVSRNSMVAFDNFFTTTRLLTDLHKRQIFACGTFQLRRKDTPPQFKTCGKMNRGEFSFQTRGPLSAVVWQDNKPVFFMSNYHDPSSTEMISRKNKDGSKIHLFAPEVVVDYNRIMGGVDRFDQLRERYAVGRRSVKWWHRIFYFLVDLGIINAFILWKILGRGVTQLKFRLALARQLVNGFSSRKKRGRPTLFKSRKSGVSSVPAEVRNIGRHYPEKQETYRRCRFCAGLKKESRTKFVCSHCKVPLCVDTHCFRRFHD